MENFFKLLKWLISMSCLIAGIYFFKIAMTHDDIRPVGLAIPLLGVVFWFSKATYEGPKKTFITGFVILALSAVIAYPLHMFYIAYYYPIGFFMTWELVMLAASIPVMWYTFMKED